jgi:adenosylcobinamide-GDP ribazoletransferase
VFDSIKSIITFLTIIPFHRTSIFDIYYIADRMYLFPLAGAFIGILIGALGYEMSFYLQPFLSGFIITAALMLVSGMHHTDALADFADGLMTKGEKETKHKAMRDPSVGSAGAAALVLYVAGMIIAISGFHQGAKLLTSIITAEVTAKYVMVLQAYTGSPAWEGFSSPFAAAMKDKRKILVATTTTVPVIWFVGSGYAGILAFSLSLAIGSIIQYASNKAFGGLSGDVLGASNEITRLSSLLFLSSVTF